MAENDRLKARITDLEAACLCFLCAHCGAPAYTPEPVQSVDSGTTWGCEKCGKGTVVYLHKPDELVAVAETQARIKDLECELAGIELMDAEGADRIRADELRIEELEGQVEGLTETARLAKQDLAKCHCWYGQPKGFGHLGCRCAPCKERKEGT